jgi:hypothetical protein
LKAPIQVKPAHIDEALAEIMFSENQSGRPVYAMPDEEALSALAERLGIPTRQAGWLVRRAAMVQIGTEDTHTRPFDRLVGQSRSTSRTALGTPPGLTTLAVLSLAADSMHAEGGMAAHNYYGRLHGLLGTPEARKAAVESGYRDHGEELWDSLNSWLEAWEGERGIPTAYVVGTMQYVGLALSQALVRRGDRQKLPALFVDEGLPPGYRMAHSDMEAILDGWMPRHPPLFSHTLRSLWTNPAARERIAGVACLELESWDGSGLDDIRPGIRHLDGHARLVAQLRRFPRSGLTFDLSLPHRSASRVTFDIATSNGPVCVNFRAAVAGTMRLDDPSAIDVESLLTDELHIAGASDQVFRRRPRRVVPFRYDELQQAFVEVETAQLGETTLVLAAVGLNAKVVALLKEVARPGWTELAIGTQGLPDGWSAFRDVQVLTRPERATHLDLQPLLPRASISLVLAGGLVLPGLLRKWSSLAPPEIYAVSPGADSLLLEVNQGTRAGNPLLAEEFPGGVAVVDLADQNLSDGEYLITVTIDRAKRPSATALLRLRSGGTPELRRQTSGLVYRPGAGDLWPVSAVPPEQDAQVDGARVSAPRLVCREPLEAMPAALPRARSAQAHQQGTPLRVGLGLGRDSCMRTGTHRIVLPPVLDGVPLTRSVEGVCSTCGLVKRYPTSSAAAVAKKKRSMAKKSLPLLDLARVPRIRVVDAGSWEPAFDALCHVGRGSIAAVSRVLSQLEGSSLAVDVLLRGLEVLGHVDVKRDPLTLEAVEWEVTPPTLVQLAENRWWLVGCRSAPNLVQLSELVDYTGGTISVTIDQQVPRVEISLGLKEIEDVVDALRDDWPELRAVRDVAEQLAAALPALSLVAGGLPRTPLPGVTSVEAWDPAGASWRSTNSIESVGAFRLTQHSRTYVLRDMQDLRDGTVTRANAQLAKHVAGLWAKDPLAGFHERSGSVVVPLGADLPGLYGRALTLSSGRLPVPAEGARMLQYLGVSTTVAAIVHDRLRH